MSLGDRVLIIDESRIVRMALRNALEAGGFWVHEAKDGDGASELLRRQGYDLVFLGVSRRVGLDLVRPARATGASVIVLAASPSAEVHARALETGAEACLAKQPGVSDEVLDVARRVLQASPTAAPANRWRFWPQAAA
jgi:DNA-binding response OmpR family regulator